MWQRVAWRGNLLVPAILIAAMAGLSDCAGGEPYEQQHGEKRRVSTQQFDVSDGEAAPSVFAWSPDGTRVAVLSRLLRKVTVFDIASGEPLGRLDNLAGGASSVAFDNAGNVLLGPLDRPADAATVWNVATGELRALPGPGGAGASVASNMLFEFVFSPSSNLLLGVHQIPEGQGARTALVVYDLSTLKMVIAGGPPAMTLAAASAADVAAFVGQSGQADILDLKTKQVVRHIDANMNRLTALALSPDGKVLATGTMPKGFGRDRRTGKPGPLEDRDILQFWDTASGERIGVAPEITMGVSSIAWSLDGNTVAVGDGVGTVFVLDGRNLGSVLSRLEPDRSPQTVVVRFAPDGRLGRLQTASAQLAIDNLAAAAVH